MWTAITIAYLVIAFCLFLVRIDVHEDIRVGWQKEAFYAIIWFPMMIIGIIKMTFKKK